MVKTSKYRPNMKKLNFLSKFARKKLLSSEHTLK